MVVITRGRPMIFTHQRSGGWPQTKQKTHGPQPSTDSLSYRNICTSSGSRSSSFLCRNAPCWVRWGLRMPSCLGRPSFNQLQSVALAGWRRRSPGRGQGYEGPSEASYDGKLIDLQGDVVPYFHGVAFVCLLWNGADRSCSSATPGLGDF
jgi:hypothetical protein